MGIEIARSATGLLLTQRKYVLDMLTETGLLGTRPTKMPMDPNCSLFDTDSPALEDKARYGRLVRKLLHAIVTMPDIMFVVSLVSRFMEQP